MFHVGQKVVCVNDDPGYSSVPGNLLDGLKANTIYTVRGEVHLTNGDRCIYLNEIVRPLEPAPRYGVRELPYLAARFRPIVDKKTDISIFQEMCKDTSDHQPEGVV